MHNIIFDNEVQVADDIEQTVVHSIIESLISEGIDIPVQVEVIITDNQSIHELNLEHRAIDKPTDVLSFPMLEYSTPAVVNACGTDFFDGYLLLGNIVISYEKAIEQAMEYGHSLNREIGFLTIHSMLHLLGYDHMNESDEQIMKDKQEQVLLTLGLNR